MDWRDGLDIILAGSNLLMLVLLTNVKANIANVKLYMHEKFVTREELLHAMAPPDVLSLLSRRWNQSREHDTL